MKQNMDNKVVVICIVLGVFGFVCLFEWRQAIIRTEHAERTPNSVLVRTHQ